MKVKVKYTSPLIRLTLKPEEFLYLPDDSKISDLLSSLSSKYGDELYNLIFNEEKQELKVSVMVNNKASNIESCLSEGDEIIFIIFMGGG